MGSRRATWFLGAVGGLAGILAAPDRAAAQVAYTPTIGTAPDGVALDVVPAVSADRRYVRVGVGASFTTVDRFQNLNIPLAAVAGGPGPGAGALGGLAGGGFRSVGVPMGMDGPAPTGAASGSSGVGGTHFAAQGFSPYAAEGYPVDDWSPSPRRPRAASRAKAARPKAPAAAARPAATPAPAPVKPAG